MLLFGLNRVRFTVIALWQFIFRLSYLLLYSFGKLRTPCIKLKLFYFLLWFLRMMFVPADFAIGQGGLAHKKVQFLVHRVDGG